MDTEIPVHASVQTNDEHTEPPACSLKLSGGDTPTADSNAELPTQNKINYVSSEKVIEKKALTNEDSKEVGVSRKANDEYVEPSACSPNGSKAKNNSELSMRNRANNVEKELGNETFINEESEVNKEGEIYASLKANDQPLYACTDLPKLSEGDTLTTDSNIELSSQNKINNVSSEKVRGKEALTNEENKDSKEIGGSGKANDEYVESSACLPNGNNIVTAKNNSELPMRNKTNNVSAENVIGKKALVNEEKEDSKEVDANILRKVVTRTEKNGKRDDDAENKTHCKDTGSPTKSQTSGNFALLTATISHKNSIKGTKNEGCQIKKKKYSKDHEIQNHQKIELLQKASDKEKNRKEYAENGYKSKAESHDSVSQMYSVSQTSVIATMPEMNCEKESKSNQSNSKGNDDNKDVNFYYSARDYATISSIEPISNDKYCKQAAGHNRLKAEQNEYSLKLNMNSSQRADRNGNESKKEKDRNKPTESSVFTAQISGSCVPDPSTKDVTSDENTQNIPGNDTAKRVINSDSKERQTNSLSKEATGGKTEKESVETQKGRIHTECSPSVSQMSRNCVPELLTKDIINGENSQNVSNKVNENYNKERDINFIQKSNNDGKNEKGNEDTQDGRISISTESPYSMPQISRGSAPEISTKPMTTLKHSQNDTSKLMKESAEVDFNSLSREATDEKNGKDSKETESENKCIASEHSTSVSLISRVYVPENSSKDGGKGDPCHRVSIWKTEKNNNNETGDINSPQKAINNEQNGEHRQEQENKNTFTAGKSVKSRKLYTEDGSKRNKKSFTNNQESISHLVKKSKKADSYSSSVNCIYENTNLKNSLHSLDTEQEQIAYQQQKDMRDCNSLEFPFLTLKQDDFNFKCETNETSDIKLKFSKEFTSGNKPSYSFMLKVKSKSRRK